MAGEPLISGVEAAEYLGITFARFKVAIWRGLGLDPNRRPVGSEPRPVSGGWSAQSAKYRPRDVRRMHAEYRFGTSRNAAPDYDWLRAIPKAEYRRSPISVAATRAKNPPTPVQAKPQTAPKRSFKLVEVRPEPFKVLDLFWN